MALTRIERNQLLKAIAAIALDTGECTINNLDSSTIISHNRSSSTFSLSVESEGGSYPSTESEVGYYVDDPEYAVDYYVDDGHHYEYESLGLDDVVPILTHWADEVKEITDTPDLWAEMQRSQESIAVIRRGDFENTPFTEDEQRQISAQLREIKNQLDNFQLPSKQMSQVEQRLDKLEEASRHLGRKDWLIMAITTVSPLVVSDIMPPGLTRHVFTFIINGMIHLFGGGPPQILA